VQLLAGRALVAPVEIHEEPRGDRHEDEDEQGRGNRPLLEERDRPVAQPRDRDLDRHDDRGDGDPRGVVGLVGIDPAELAEERHNEVEDDPGVHRRPADGQDGLDARREVGAAASEGGSSEHHARHAGALAEQDEEAEHRHADEVADRQDEDGVHQAEAEVDPESAEDPVDRGDVGSRPDPELCADVAVASLLRNRLQCLFERVYILWRRTGDGLFTHGRFPLVASRAGPGVWRR
jgi:hypothetical protein